MVIRNLTVTVLTAGVVLLSGCNTPQQKPYTPQPQAQLPPPPQQPAPQRGGTMYPGSAAGSGPVPSMESGPVEDPGRARGGTKGGTIYGETDDFSYNIVQDPVHIRDFHATVLHQLGYDHKRLSFKYQGLDQRLTGVLPARVVTELVA